MSPHDVGLFRSLITESDNVTVSPSFAAAAFGIYILLPIVIVVLVSVTVLDVIVNHHEANPGGLGGGIAAVIASVGGYILGLSVLLGQDKKPDPPAVTTTTTTTATGVVPPLVPAGATGADPLQVHVDNLEPSDGGKKRKAAKA